MGQASVSADVKGSLRTAGVSARKTGYKYRESQQKARPSPLGERLNLYVSTYRDTTAQALRPGTLRCLTLLVLESI